MYPGEAARHMWSRPGLVALTGGLAQFSRFDLVAFSEDAVSEALSQIFEAACLALILHAEASFTRDMA